MTNNNSAPDEYQDSLQMRITKFFESFQNGDAGNNKNSLIGVVVVVALIVAFLVYQGKNQAKKANLESEVLGKGLAALYAQDQPLAIKEFSQAIESGEISGLSLAKASLLLGNIQLQKGELTLAKASFELTLANAGNILAFVSAAEHGLATVLMDEKKFSEAEVALNQYVNKYSQRNPTPSELAKDEFLDDLVHGMDDALFKLALCQKELKNFKAAQITCEKILKSYAGSRRAADAKKLLSALG
jgi:TolA-binding protein